MDATATAGDGIGAGGAPLDAAQSDHDLAARAASDPAAFAALYDRHYDSVLNYTFRRTLNLASAEELTGTTFLKALRSIRGYQPTGSFRGWLLRIAANEVHTLSRTQRRRPTLPLSDADLDRITFDDTPETLAEQKEQRLLEFARVLRALRRLPEKYQAAISLRYLQDLTNEEIALALRKRPGTIKSLISRGLVRLRAALGRQLEQNHD